MIELLSVLTMRREGRLERSIAPRRDGPSGTRGLSTSENQSAHGSDIRQIGVGTHNRDGVRSRSVVSMSWILANEWMPRDRVLSNGEEPALAAHLVSSRGLYSHHGIYAGRNRVIHYAGLSSGFRRGPVEEVSLDTFARGASVRVRRERLLFDRSEVLRRARARLGENEYRLFSNNCKHFCRWCLSDPVCDGECRGQKRASTYMKLTKQVVATIQRVCNGLPRRPIPLPPRPSAHLQVGF
jgi:Lecithin retinol acyltransferase